MTAARGADISTLREAGLEYVAIEQPDEMLVPKIRQWITQESGGMNGITRERIIKGIYCDWHNTGVRLASRIYGEMQRRVTRKWERSKISRG